MSVSNQSVPTTHFLSITFRRIGSRDEEVPPKILHLTVTNGEACKKSVFGLTHVVCMHNFY